MTAGKPSGRPLTPDEVALARGMFGDAIAYDRVRIHNRKWWPLHPRKVTMAPDGDLWFHPDGGLFCEDFCAAPVHLRGHFLHEMTHVWQAQRSGKWWLPLMRHPWCRYDYRVVPGKSFGRYGIEQQAEIVRHAFLLRQGMKVADKPGLEAYDRLLPFMPS